MYRKRDVEILFEVKQLLYDHRVHDRGSAEEASWTTAESAGNKEQMELGFARTDRGGDASGAAAGSGRSAHDAAGSERFARAGEEVSPG